MTRRASLVLYVALAVAAVVLAGAAAVWWVSRPTRAEVLVRREIEARLSVPPAPSGDGIEAATREFYRRRGRRAAWSDGRTPSDDALAAARALADLGRDGLDPARYGGDTLAARIERLRRGGLQGLLPDPQPLAALDLALTRAWLHGASDLHDGRLPDSALDRGWVAARGRLDLVRTLRRALASHRSALDLADLAPTGEDYQRLRVALWRYRAIAEAGGWPRLADGPVLKRGASGPAVLSVRRRLAIEGDSTGLSPEFDAGLARALRAVQARHGLAESGVLDSATRAALNVSAPARVRQMELNLERWRWLPRSFPEPCVFVDLAAFRLEVRDSGRVLLRSRVVVGEPRNPTPSFSAALSYIVLNPTWRVPKRILVEETLPALARDTTWLAKHQMRVYFTHAPALREIAASAVDWTAVEEDSFPYLVIQDPGDENPLGRVKLMCPNPYDVYLHDTPLKGYFSAAARAYSHGCVRVEKARELAEWLLARDTLVDATAKPGPRKPRTPDARDSLQAVIESLATRPVGLAHKVPVHFLYWTAWVDSAGAVEFRDDLYKIDRRLEEALATGKVADFVLNPPVEWGEKHRKEPGVSESTARLAQRVSKAFGIVAPAPPVATPARSRSPGREPRAATPGARP